LAASTPPDAADAAAEKAVAGVLGRTAAKAAAPGSTTGLTLAVAAADRKSLSRSQTSAINRAQTILAGPFDVSVSYSPADESNDEGEATSRLAAEV
jgi:hypothetical protein